MKTSILLLALLVGSMSQGSTNCKDSNFNDLEGKTSPLAPAAVGDYFGRPPSICYDLNAEYLKHKPSGKVYVIYTTHKDYCDGGNTSGIIVDLGKYRDLGLSYPTTSVDFDGEHYRKWMENSIVADISDSQIYCR